MERTPRFGFGLLGLCVLGLALGIGQDDKTAPPHRTGTVRGVLKNPWVKRAEAAVFLERIEGMEFPPPKEPAVMDQKNLVFTPHVLVVQKGTAVRFPNSDTVRHNVFSPPTSPRPFNLGTYDVGVVKEVVFDKPGVVPLLCNVHAEMSAFLLVTETPFFAKTDPNGAFTIEGVPAGKRRLTAWHEKLQPQTVEVEVPARGVVEVVFENFKRK